MNQHRNTDTEYMPPWIQAIPLGLQHVLTMFTGNITAPVIVAGMAGLAGGDKGLLIQAAMLIAGVYRL